MKYYKQARREGLCYDSNVLMYQTDKGVNCPGWCLGEGNSIQKILPLD